jgi:hypothetical protein
MPPGQGFRTVIDTNVFVSRFLNRKSIPAEAVNKAVCLSDLLISSATFAELEEVLLRPKFDAYLSLVRRREFLDDLWAISTFIAIPTPIRACRDPKDDKFLEVAVHGRADAIITGDSDLLVLNPFRGIAILTPREYLDSQ